ncbi:uncharacterized protein Z520_01521 [Fonsecaea multimorphosa CBS 102226]|uniref:Thioredoxin domain-containing protein n=1 Tax=Fonsecaea multimorphosa CBS 102226 TaxID=1442371 RepID=A0A0D2KHW6_9EURO|nr:uncharacterized protein Z520_01521 [Fonsecaea multimorphosa CBS 102226]KIY03055.1 hypothetical protein Z520_01521 [Fonsecaea multimorphosa CBS 102226]OAL30550.1 hypothetical protein AYO22_01502 [Fonsecaea multimorphosa]
MAVGSIAAYQLRRGVGCLSFLWDNFLPDHSPVSWARADSISREIPGFLVSSHFGCDLDFTPVDRSSIVTKVLSTVVPLFSQPDRPTLDTLKSLDIPVFLFTELEGETSQSSAVVTQVAEKLHGKFFVATTTDPTLAEEGGAQPPFVVVWNSHDEVKPVYHDKLELGRLLKFAEKASTPVIGRLDLKSYIDHTQSTLPLAFILAETDKERKAIAESLKYVALKHKLKVNFVTLDTTKLPFLLEPLGVDSTRLPAFAIHRGDNEEVSVYDQNRQINAKDVEIFLHRTLNWPLKEL